MAGNNPLPGPIESIVAKLAHVSGQAAGGRVQDRAIILVGAGAVGSWAMVGLGAGLPVGYRGELVVCDNDRVAAPDLPRNPLAAWIPNPVGRAKVRRVRRALGRFRPDLRVRAIDGAVQTALSGGDLLGAAVAIVATDDRASRLDLTHRAAKVGIPVVEAGLYADAFHVGVYDPPRGPCYEETLNERDWKHIAIQYSCRELWQGTAGAAPGSRGALAALAGLSLAGLAVLAAYGARPEPRLIHVASERAFEGSEHRVLLSYVPRSRRRWSGASDAGLQPLSASGAPAVRKAARRRPSARNQQGEQATSA